MAEICPTGVHSPAGVDFQRLIVYEVTGCLFAVENIVHLLV